MSVQILGIGTAVPEFEIEQRDAAQQASQLSGATAQQERAVSTLYRCAGVKKRHSVVLESSTNGRPARQRFYTSDGPPLGPTTAERMQVYDTHAAPLAIEAARRALVEANVQAGGDHARGQRIVQWIFRAGNRCGAVARTRARAGNGAHTYRLHGLPGGAKRNAGGESVCRKRSQRMRTALCRRVVQPASSVHVAAGSISGQCLVRRRGGGAGASVAGDDIARLVADRRCALDCDRRFRGHDELANQRSWLPNDAVAASAGVDRPQLASLARFVVTRTQPDGRPDRLVGRSSRRAADCRRLCASDQRRRRLFGRFVRRVVGVRQHVIAHGAVHSRPIAPAECPAPVPGVGVWAGNLDRGGVACGSGSATIYLQIKAQEDNR